MRIPHAAVVSLLSASALVAQNASWPYSMDFGPALMTTFDGGGLCGTTEKGLVVRLGDDGAVAFDTELLRMSVAWTDGWLRLRGTAYDGSHGPFPSRRGQALAETRVGPGWYRGERGDDPRPIPHGPLPTAWGRYGGHRRVGDEIVIDYRVGDMVVREHYGLESQDVPVLLRTLELGPSKQPQTMVVFDGPEGSGSGAGAVGDVRLAMLQWQPKAGGKVEYEGTTAGWDTLSLGAPARDDYLQKHGCGVTFVDGFATAHGKSADDRRLPVLVDGKGAASDDDWQGSAWFDKHKVGNRNTDHGRYLIELDAALDVSRIHTYSWHKGGRAVQRYTVYGSDGADPAAKDPAANGWTRIAEVDSSSLGQGDKHVVAIADRKGLGRFRHLLFDCHNGGTFFSEIDVYAADVRARVDRDGRARRNLVATVYGSDGPTLEVDGSRVLLRVPVHDAPQRVQLAIAACEGDQLAALTERLMKPREVAALPSGPSNRRWGEPIVTEGVRGSDDGPFAVDTITIPFENPFGSRMRTGAFDFFSDGRAAVSTWNGDVWVVSGIDDDLDRLEWRRFATGLFDPLGLRIVDDVVYVHGRDGLTRLIDSNEDGEADRYENFNNQVYITPAFHEFAFDLQTDQDGNFYFSKGAPVNPGGRGFMKIVPHHGTILKVAK
ncbi:MAG: hypothetical protein KAI24_22925, partial [Planctomycetes bacterium]|nr:hypothetical protein [Planctomycetota bacterium]